MPVAASKKPDSLSTATAQRRPGGWDGLLIASASLLVYLCFLQTTVYQADGYQFCVWVTSGQTRHPVHYAFLPLLHVWKDLLHATLGLRFYTAGCALGSVGTALGLLFVHRGCRALGRGRFDAAAVTALVACAPGVFFFATVLEVHGAFFAGAGCAFWLGCRMISPHASHWSGPAFGLATGLSFTLHASAAVLPFTLGLWLLADSLARRSVPLQTTITRLFFAALAHAACVSAALIVIPRWLRIPEDNAVAAWDRFDWGAVSETLLPTLNYEWTYAFVPISLWYLLGFANRITRLQAIALTVGLLPYLTVALKIIPAANEHGAYLLPMSIPAAVITTACIRSRWFVGALIALGLGTSIAFVVAHDNPEPSRRLAADIDAAAEGTPVNLFVTEQHGMEACMSFLDDARMIWVGDLLRAPPAVIEAIVPIWVRDAEREGRTLLLPDSVKQGFLVPQSAVFPTAKTLLDAIEAHARSVPVEHGNFRGTALHTR